MTRDLSTDESLAAYAKVCPEIVLWTLIDSLGGLAWRLNHDANRDGARGYITPSAADRMREDAEKLRRRVALCAAEVTRFGVPSVLKKIVPDGTPLAREAALPVVSEASKPTVEGVELNAPSDDYWRWYKWWAEYVRGLPDAEFRELDADMTAERDLSRWRPQGDWRAPSSPLSERQPAASA